MKIAIGGAAGSGKDEVAKVLIEKHGFARLGLADPMKRMFAHALDIDIADVEKLKSGKDIEAYEHFISTRPEFAGLDRVEVANLVRRALQTLGTEWGRKNVHTDLWVHRLARKANLYEKEWFDFAESKKPWSQAPASLKRGVVVTDLRFENEMDVLKKAGFYTAYLRTNPEWERIQPPAWKRLGDRAPKLAHRLTRHPYYHPSEAEGRAMADQHKFNAILGNWGKTVHGHRHYDHSPDYTANRIISLARQHRYMMPLRED